MINILKYFITDTPPAKRGRGRPMEHPWLTLGINEGFELPKSYSVARSYAYRASQTYGRTFVAERIDDTSSRITRVA